MLGKIEGRRRRERQRMQWLDGIIHSMDMNLSKLWEIVKNREAWRAAVHGVAKTEQQQLDQQIESAAWGSGTVFGISKSCCRPLLCSLWTIENHLTAQEWVLPFVTGCLGNPWCRMGGTLSCLLQAWLTATLLLVSSRGGKDYTDSPQSVFQGRHLFIVTFW